MRDDVVADPPFGGVRGKVGVVDRKVDDRAEPLHESEGNAARIVVVARRARDERDEPVSDAAPTHAAGQTAGARQDRRRVENALIVAVSEFDVINVAAQHLSSIAQLATSNCRAAQSVRAAGSAITRLPRDDHRRNGDVETTRQLVDTARSSVIDPPASGAAPISASAGSNSRSKNRKNSFCCVPIWLR